MIWILTITPKNHTAACLKLYGISFFERRLREALKWGVDHVFVLCDNTDTLPKVDSRFCSPYTVVSSREEIPQDAHAVIHDVAVNGLVEQQQPHQLACVVDGPQDLSKARKWSRQKILRESCTGWVGKNINKKISFLFSEPLASLGVTPNVLTFLNLCVGLLSAYCVSQSSYMTVVLGGFLFQMASVWDGVDGEVAKFRLEFSKLGAVLDTVGDNTTLLAFLMGVGVHVYRSGVVSDHMFWFLVTCSLVGVLLVMGLLFWVSYGKFGEASLTGYEKHFLKKLPNHDIFVLSARKTKSFIQKDTFSLLFFGICLLGLVPYLLHGLVFVLVVAIVHLIYFHARYAAKF